MGRIIPILVLAMLLAAVTGAAGCGDDDGSDGTAASGGAAGAEGGGDEGGAEEAGDDSGEASGESVETSSLSKEEYVKQASAACTKRREKVLSEMAAALGPIEKRESAPDETGKAVKEVILPAFEDEIAIIRGLGAPEGDEEEIEAILAAEEAAIEEAKKVKNPKSFEEIAKPFAESTETMKEYGFTSCVKS